MAVSLKLADAFVDLTINRSQFNAGLATAISQLNQLKGLGAVTITLNRAAATSSLGLLRQQITALQQQAAAGLNFGRVQGGFGGGGGRGGIGGGVAGQGLTGLMQGLGVSGFALNPAMAAGQMAGGAIMGGIELVAEGIRESAATAMDLQSTFVGIQRVTGASADEVARFKQSIFDIAARQSGVSVEDLTGIAMTGAKAGVSDKEGLPGLERFTAGLAQVRNSVQGIGTDQLADNMIRMLNLFGKGTDYVQSFGSVLARMDNASTASASSILDMGKSLSGTFASLRMGIPEVMAFSSALADSGLTAQQGASSFSQIFRLMASQGGKFSAAAGVPREQWNNLMNTGQAMTALKLLVDKFKEINAIDPTKAQEWLSGLGLKGVRTAGAFQQMATVIDKVFERTKMAKEEEMSLGSLVSADALKSTETQGSVQKLKNAIIELKDAVGVHFLPAIDAAASSLQGMTRAAASGVPAAISGVKEMGKAAAFGAAGPAAGAVGLARAAMDMLIGPDSAEAIPGKATGMAPPWRRPTRDVGGGRDRMVADVEAGNAMRRAAEESRANAKELIGDMAEDIGGVGNLINAPSRFRNAGAMPGWGTGQQGGIFNWGGTDEGAIAQQEETRKKFEQFEEEKRTKKFQSQTFTDPADFARSAIQSALSSKEDTPKLTLSEQKQTNKHLADLIAKVSPTTPNPKAGPLIFASP